MADISTVYLRALESRLGRIAYQFTRVHVQSFRPRETWAPPINAYRCQAGFVICVELAGVVRSQIDLQVDARTVLIRGHREPPAPNDQQGQPTQVLAFEIDHGSFEREILLPMDVDPEKVQAEQRDGLLWISLPLRNAP